MSRLEGGTIQWMSPELLHPDESGLKGSLPTKASDCYALGMVIYEVLSGQAPFAQYKGIALILKIMGGELPGRPQGAWFTDGLWEMLERCWNHQPRDRPGLKALLQYLEGTTRTSRSLPPCITANEDTTTDTDDPSDPALTNDRNAASISPDTSGGERIKAGGFNLLPPPSHLGRTVSPPTPHAVPPPSTPGKPSLTQSIYHGLPKQ